MAKQYTEAGAKAASATTALRSFFAPHAADANKNVEDWRHLESYEAIASTGSNMYDCSMCSDVHRMIWHPTEVRVCNA